MTGKRARMQLLDATLVAAEVHGVQEVFPHGFEAWLASHKIPRATGYRHLARVRAEGCWRQRSRRPANSPNRVCAEVEQHIVRLRTELGRENGARSIHASLLDLAAEQDWAGQGLVVPCPATIHRVLVRRDLVVPEPRKRPKSSYRRFTYARPRDCYQIDGTEVVLATGAKAVVLEVLDDCTRVLVASHPGPAENTASAIAAIRAAFDSHGVPALVLSDNATTFTSRFTKGGTSKFTQFVTDSGARLIHSSPYHPQTCGKVERAHRTFKEWLADQPDQPATMAQLEQACDTYRHWYNTQRRHSVHNTTPQAAWDTAPDYGGPQHLPIQQDADVLHRKLSNDGRLNLGPMRVTIGRAHAHQQVTVIRDHNHITVYDLNGHTLGDLTLDPTRNGQGQLRPAA